MKVSGLFLVIGVLCSACASAGPDGRAPGGVILQEQDHGAPLPDFENFDRAGEAPAMA